MNRSQCFSRCCSLVFVCSFVCRFQQVAALATWPPAQHCSRLAAALEPCLTGPSCALLLPSTVRAAFDLPTVAHLAAAVPTLAGGKAAPAKRVEAKATVGLRASPRRLRRRGPMRCGAAVHETEAAAQGRQHSAEAGGGRAQEGTLSSRSLASAALGISDAISNRCIGGNALHRRTPRRRP